MQTGLLLVVVLKSLVELSAMFILGQGILYVLAVKNRETNLFYQLFRVITKPLYAAARFITPRAILDRHIPYVTLILLFWIWVFATYMKIDICRSGAVQCEQPAQTERAK
jgi:hypothetical protein